jgi:ArsR family transcriptional regulator
MLTDVSTGVNMSRDELVSVIDEACCPQLLQAPLGVEEAEELATMLKAIADPARLRLLSLLATAEPQEACVCDLTAPIGLGQPTVSHHLKVLTEAGLIEREQRGRWVFYSLTDDAVRRLGHVLRLEGAEATR